jgi:DNA repair protein SbcD/Mre11
MHGTDHEFTIASLFEAEADVVALGHIHLHQQWQRGGRIIAYAGSAGRLHYGERGEKVSPIYRWCNGSFAGMDLTVLPARRMVEIEFIGVPDLDVLKQYVDESVNAFVRVRCTVDAEFRDQVDRQGINTLLGNAAEVKIEVKVNPILRSRAEGISTAPSLTDKLAQWASLSNVDTTGLDEKLARLENGDAGQIVRDIVTEAA